MPREKFQGQCLKLIEHVAEEFAELVLSVTEFIERNARRLDNRPWALGDRLTRQHA